MTYLGRVLVSGCLTVIFNLNPKIRLIVTADGFYYKYEPFRLPYVGVAMQVSNSRRAL